MDTPIGISIYDNAVQDCDKIIAWLESRDWQESTTVGEIEGYRTSDTTSFPLLDFKNDSCVHEMNKVVWRLMDEYAKKWDFPFIDIEPISVQRYQIGQFYKPHCDSGPTLQRVVSALVYLNNVDGGGETEFTHFDYKVSPRAGRVVIFPSNYIYTHRAIAPENGVKYAAAYWARG
jgi:hypothetical protein